MNASSRRHTRYVISEGALLSQQIKGKGLVAALLGWADCRVRDLSIAGAMILTEKKKGIGDPISMKLTQRNGDELQFEGKVVNCGTDHRSGHFQLGIALNEQAPETREHIFLHSLGDSFPEAR
ncbi:PilZ domain-containing protein (plasmid) [Pseudomonas cannabina pv. alisalensis]|uniref:PilZ domain-containing protein n=1 Tax=Pseudomonas syringae pv. maculicola str. ES4326 TaxID=629265 RepID=A0A8T8CAG0_PSEYM|nr:MULTISPECIES: PilZ domain-containing protein [Pseudomonas syringae group]QHF00570.1 PilZ domain-containing protein [Pseudomonas syringae pv. maculicola str. ES4326]UBZ00553.1 PilZ domain-containing protein [Pseudomonas cannabina pv. alisalensis]